MITKEQKERLKKQNEEYKKSIEKQLKEIIAIFEKVEEEANESEGEKWKD